MQLVIAVIGFLLSGAVFFFYTKPTYDEVKVVQSQIAQYDSVLEKSAELQRIKQTLLSRYNAFNPTDLDRLRKLLPDHVDNVRLILDLDNLAARHGIALQNVDVTSSASLTQGSQDVAIEIGSSDQKYDSLTFSFGTTASYKTFLQFLNDLETSLRIVDLVSLTMDPSSAEVGTQAEPKYSYKVTLRTYWLK
jgi:Tfp pilus assembly protein PilO